MLAESYDANIALMHLIGHGANSGYAIVMGTLTAFFIGKRMHRDSRTSKKETDR